MTIRKGPVLALSALAFTLGGLGLSLASARDDESKLHKAMEKVQKNNGIIVKGTKTAAVFKKSQKDVVNAAKELAKIGKEVREEDVPEKGGKPNKKLWTDLMDAYVKECEAFAEVAGKDDAKQADVKGEFRKVSATCAACHEKFRSED